MAVNEWFRPLMTGQEAVGLQKVLDSNFLNDGPVTREFESRFTSFLGVQFGVAVSNCTSGLFMCLKASGVGPGDEVIVPDLTFIATAHAVQMAGANAVLVDCNIGDLTIDISRVSEAISPKTRAVIAVDVNGRPADYSELSDLCQANDLVLIADLAEAIGQIDPSALGSGAARAGVFSFSPNKTITTGQGGFIATNSPEFYAALIEIKDQGRPVRGTGGDDFHPAIGFNFKFTDLQAAVGLAQLDDLTRRIEHAAWRTRAYREALEDVPKVYLLETSAEAFVQWQDILHEDPVRCSTALREACIGFRRFWRPLHTQPSFQADPSLFPNASLVSSQGFWLPSSYDLSSEDIHTVASCLRLAA